MLLESNLLMYMPKLSLFLHHVAVGILTNVKRVYKIKKMGKLFNQCFCARYLDYISSTVTILKG